MKSKAVKRVPEVGAWHWPDRRIGKRESRRLREDHNETYNRYHETREALIEMLALWDDLGRSNPGFMRNLVLQDYQRLNEAPIKVHAALAKAQPEKGGGA